VSGVEDSSVCYCAVQPQGPLASTSVVEGVLIGCKVAISSQARQLVEEETLPLCPQFTSFVARQQCTLQSLTADFFLGEVSQPHLHSPLRG
jgi:hypothetical protein